MKIVIQLICCILFLTPCFSEGINVSGTNNSGVKWCEADKILLTVGDSLTFGTGSTNSWSYRKKLQIHQDVEYAFVGIYDDPASDPVYSVLHSGFPGADTYYMETTILPASIGFFVDGGDPTNSIIIIHAGTNDVLSTTAGREGARDNIEDMIDYVDAYNPDISVYISLIAPAEIAGRFVFADVVTFNGILKTMLDAYKASKSNLYYVDIHTAFTADTYGYCSGDWYANCMYNDSHPNNDGYSTMADQYNDCINNSAAVNCNGN